MKKTVVIEIRGGTLVGLYASDPRIEAHLVDWDEIAEHPDGVKTRAYPDPLSAMPAETSGMVGRRAKRSAARSGS